MRHLGDALIVAAERLAPRRRAPRVRPWLEQLRPRAKPLKALWPLQLVVDVRVDERARAALDDELRETEVQQREAACKGREVDEVGVGWGC